MVVLLQQYGIQHQQRPECKITVPANSRSPVCFSQRTRIRTLVTEFVFAEWYIADFIIADVFCDIFDHRSYLIYMRINSASTKSLSFSKTRPAHTIATISVDCIGMDRIQRSHSVPTPAYDCGIGNLWFIRSHKTFKCLSEHCEVVFP